MPRQKVTSIEFRGTVAILLNNTIFDLLSVSLISFIARVTLFFGSLIFNFIARKNSRVFFIPFESKVLFHAMVRSIKLFRAILKLYQTMGIYPPQTASPFRFNKGHFVFVSNLLVFFLSTLACILFDATSAYDYGTAFYGCITGMKINFSFYDWIRTWICNWINFNSSINVGVLFDKNVENGRHIGANQELREIHRKQ